MMLVKVVNHYRTVSERERRLDKGACFLLLDRSRCSSRGADTAQETNCPLISSGARFMASVYCFPRFRHRSLALSCTNTLPTRRSRMAKHSIEVDQPGNGRQGVEALPVLNALRSQTQERWSLCAAGSHTTAQGARSPGDVFGALTRQYGCSDMDHRCPLRRWV